jgi:hypothetical protein
MCIIVIKPSALKHGHTETEIRQVLAGGERFDINPDSQDNPQQAVIGFTENEVLLEVLVTYLSNIDSVYHCVRATRKWADCYTERLRDTST